MTHFTSALTSWELSGGAVTTMDYALKLSREHSSSNVTFKRVAFFFPLASCSKANSLKHRRRTWMQASTMFVETIFTCEWQELGSWKAENFSRPPSKLLLCHWVMIQHRMMIYARRTINMVKKQIWINFSVLANIQNDKSRKSCRFRSSWMLFAVWELLNYESFDTWTREGFCYSLGSSAGSTRERVNERSRLHENQCWRT